MIQSGDADAVVDRRLRGRADAARHAPPSRALDALSTTGISRPFDARRDGFVMGEGAGVLVLEDGETARGARRDDPRRARAATARRSDAHHLTAPRPGRRAAPPRAMHARAARTPGSTPEDVDYVNAHGTSTPLNDRAETSAIKIGARRPRRRDPGLLDRSRRSGTCSAPPAPSRRSPRMLALRDRDRAADARLRGARRGARPRLRARTRRGRWTSTASRAVALSNSFGFGGHNAVLCLEACMTVDARSTSAADERLTPLERLEALCDPGSLHAAALRRRARAAWASKARAGDGVIAGAGRVDGRPVFCYAQDPSLPRRLARRAARRLDRARAAAGRPRRRARRRLHRVRRRAHAGGRSPRSPATAGSSASTSRCRAASRRSP